MTLPAPSRGSTVLLDEYFSIEDARFIDELRRIADSGKLAGFVERWKKDPRPWARKQILAYLELPLDCEGHHPVVKRLYKHAEAQRDHELVAAFCVAFDRLVRRVKRTRFSWDFDTRESAQIEHLFSPRNTLIARKTPGWTARNPRTGEAMAVPWRPGKHRRLLFSYHTRAYLRRRVWRYFRWLGHQHPEQYAAAVATALMLYNDADVKSGENILDCWSLLHICFGEHEALEFGSAHAAVKEGRALSELSARPMFEELWTKPEALKLLFGLVFDAHSRLVRVWATQLLRARHADALKNLSVEILLRLLEHADDEVQQFGAELLASLSNLDKLPLDTWLKLLQTSNLTALQTICDAFLRHVQSERLTLAQCVELACEQPASVAKLGVAYLKLRKIASADERRVIAGVAHAKSAAVGGELAEWALPILGAQAGYDREAVCAFFDSLLKETRAAAWKWLLKKEGPAYDDAGLWARMLETPYDDVRLPLVDLLQVRALPGTSADALEPVWCAVLLSIHRGGRQKSKAVRQIGDAIRENPARAARLLPVLAVAVRSVRPAEARAGLASLVSTAVKCPELIEAIQKHLPELKLNGLKLNGVEAPK